MQQAGGSIDSCGAIGHAHIISFTQLIWLVFSLSELSTELRIDPAAF
jgi:hypothetical protein